MSLDIWLWSPNELKSAGLINEKTLALSRLSKENSNHHCIRKFKSSFKRKFKSSHCTGILAKQHCLKEFKIKSLHLRFASLKDYMILLIFPASKFKCSLSLYLLFYAKKDSIWGWESLLKNTKNFTPHLVHSPSTNDATFKK